MKLYLHMFMKRFLFLFIFILLITACSPQPEMKATPAADTSDEQNNIIDEETVILSSLEKVDDYPLYIMHSSGGTFSSQSSKPLETDFACSLFAALPQTGEKLYGRNFDWDYSPALLLFNTPPDGYASVSMVNLTFLGITTEEARTLDTLPLSERTALLSAPRMPFDGMNEYGLAIGMAAVPETDTGNVANDPSKPVIGSIGIIREVLDHARTVEEAVDIFENYTIDFNGGPPIHYLIADASGKAVLVEIYDGETIVLPNEQPWHLATNHLRCIANGDGGCPRYRLLSEKLNQTGGKMDKKDAMRLLSDVAQDGTQWSVVYNLTSGDVSVVIGQGYEQVYSFKLDRVSP